LAISYFGLLEPPAPAPYRVLADWTDGSIGCLDVFSFLHAIGIFFVWEVNFLDYFFYWVLVGCVTLALRISRTFKAAIQKDLSVGKKINEFRLRLPFYNKVFF